MMIELTYSVAVQSLFITSSMLSKHRGAMHLIVLVAILAGTVLTGLLVIYFLDRALIAQTVSRIPPASTNPTEPNLPMLAGDQLQPKPTLGAANPAVDDSTPATSKPNLATQPSNSE